MLSCDGKQGRVVPALCPRPCYKSPGIWKDQLGRGCTILIPWGSGRHEFDIRIWSAGTANKPVDNLIQSQSPKRANKTHTPHAPLTHTSSTNLIDHSMKKHTRSLTPLLNLSALGSNTSAALYVLETTSTLIKNRTSTEIDR